MTEYVEELLLKIKTDKTELENAQKAFDDLKVKDILSPQAKKDLEDAYKMNESQLFQLKQIEKEMAVLSGLKGDGVNEALKVLKAAHKSLKKERESKETELFLKDSIKSGIVNAGKSAWNSIKNYAMSVIDDAFEMMKNEAAFSNRSTIFSEEASSLKLNYGLEGAEAYALQNALKDVGLSGVDEYLEKSWMLNDEQRKYLSEQINLYKQSYEQDEEIALEFQKYKVEMEQFKKEAEVDIIHFFMENKNTIKTTLSALLQMAEAAIKFFGWFIGMYSQDTTRSDYERRAATSDILNSYINNNNAVSSRSVSVNNTFNGVQSSDRTELLNASNIMYTQIIKALD